MVHEHKFITYDDRYSKPYLLQIQQKDIKPNKFIVMERFNTLEEAIVERDKFLSNYKDKRYKGIAFCKSSKKWRSNIFIKGKTIFLKRHDTQEEAKEFRNKILMDLMN